LPQIPSLLGADASQSAVPPHYHSGRLSFGGDSLLRRPGTLRKGRQVVELLFHRFPSTVIQPTHVGVDLYSEFWPEPQTTTPQYSFCEHPQVCATGADSKPQWERFFSNELAHSTIRAALLNRRADADDHPFPECISSKGLRRGYNILSVTALAEWVLALCLNDLTDGIDVDRVGRPIPDRRHRAGLHQHQSTTSSNAPPSENDAIKGRTLRVEQGGCRETVTNRQLTGGTLFVYGKADSPIRV
jgi:hypothetical protein